MRGWERRKRSLMSCIFTERVLGKRSRNSERLTRPGEIPQESNYPRISFNPRYGSKVSFCTPILASIAMKMTPSLKLAGFRGVNHTQSGEINDKLVASPQYRVRGRNIGRVDFFGKLEVGNVGPTEPTTTPARLSGVSFDSPALPVDDIRITNSV